MQRHSLIECTYTYISIADACQRNSLMQANLHRFYIYIYIYLYMYISIVCMYHAWAREAIAMQQCAYCRAVQPSGHECPDGWWYCNACWDMWQRWWEQWMQTVVTWISGRWRRFIVICTCQKRIYIYICCMICWFLYMFFLLHFMLAPSYLGPKYN